jgi:beta-xylosidase
LKGRALGHEGQKVVLDDGTIAAGAYHIFSDGGGVVARADGTGYYYMCNSETGICYCSTTTTTFTDEKHQAF